MSEGNVSVSGNGVGVVVGTGSGDDSQQREEDRAAADTIDQLNQRHQSEADSASASSGCAEDPEYTTFLQQRAQGDEAEVMHSRQPQSYSREDEMILPHQQQSAQSHYRYVTPQEFTGIFPQYGSHMTSMHMYKNEEDLVIKRDVEEHADDRYEDILELGDKVDVRRNLDVCSNASGRSSEGLEHGTPPGLDYAENKDGLLDLHLPHRDMRIHHENSTNFVHLAAALHSPGAHSHTQDGEDTTDLYQSQGTASQESLHRLQPAYQQSEVIQHSNNYQS